MKLILLIGFLFISSCDFSPKLQQEILKAQDLISRGEYKNATGLYEKILTMNMGAELRVKILYQTADLYSIFLGDVEKGKKYYYKVFEVTQNPKEQLKALERIGELDFTYLKNYKESLSIYKKLISLYDGSANRDFFDYRMALSYFNMGNYENAKLDFEKILKNPSHQYNTISLYYIGLISFRKNE